VDTFSISTPRDATHIQLDCGEAGAVTIFLVDVEIRLKMDRFGEVKREMLDEIIKVYALFRKAVI